MKEDLLASVELSTTSAPDASVIWLHGLGADGHDFVPILPQLQLPSSLSVRFIFPHAPAIPITCNDGYVMRAWYDIHHLDNRILLKTDIAGIVQSTKSIEDLIAREHTRGILSERIVLVGFSQGGVIAYMAGLTHSKKLAGVVGLSTYLPGLEVLESIKPLSLINQNMPIFAAHGLQDHILPLHFGQMAYQQLHDRGYPITWHTYPMAHSVCVEEIKAIGQFLVQILK